MDWNHTAQTILDLGLTLSLPPLYLLAMRWVGSHIHNKDVSAAMNQFGGVAYQALVAATHDGKLDFAAAKRVGIAAGLQALNAAAVPAIANLPDEAKGAIVQGGLGGKLAADPTVGAVPTAPTVIATGTGATAGEAK